MLTRIFKKLKRDLAQIKKPRKTEYIKPIYTKIQKPSYYGLCGVKAEYHVIWPILVPHGFSVSTHKKDMIILDSSLVDYGLGDYKYYAEKGSQVISEDEYNKAAR